VAWCDCRLRLEPKGIGVGIERKRTGLANAA
jgi:hypothetical protein